MTAAATPSSCTNCGAAAVHWRLQASGPAYCRPCAERRGHRWPFYVELDVDLLRDLCGEDLARLLLERTRAR